MNDKPIGPGPIEEFRRQIELRNPVRSYHVTIDEVYAALTGIPRIKSLSMADVHGIVRKLNANQDAKLAATQAPPDDAREATPRESELLALLIQARLWGIASKGYDASVAISVAREVDALAARPAQPAEDWAAELVRTLQHIADTSDDCDSRASARDALATPTAGDAT